jgi:hypothetical protein
MVLCSHSMQPIFAVRDRLRWDALGNRPLIVAANSRSSCDCVCSDTPLWCLSGTPLGRPLTAVTRVLVPYALPAATATRLLHLDTTGPAAACEPHDERERRGRADDARHDQAAGRATARGLMGDRAHFQIGIDDVLRT